MNKDMKKPGKEFRIGLMVVATVVVAYFAINYLRDKDVFNREHEYVVTYDDVNGLKTSAGVYVRGFKAGTVERVEYSPESGDFHVFCSVDKRFGIPSDSRFEIYSSDLMGGKSVRVLEGASGSMAVSGDTMRGVLAPDMMGSLMEKLPGILDNAGSVLDSVSLAVGSLRGILDANSADLRSILASLASVSSEIDRIASDAGDVVPDLKIFSEKMKELSEVLAGRKGDIGSFISDLSEVSSQLKDAGIGEITSSLSRILSSLEQGEGSAGLLLKNDSLYLRVDSLVSDVDSLVRAIKDNPKKYIRVSIF